MYPKRATSSHKPPIHPSLHSRSVQFNFNVYSYFFVLYIVYISRIFRQIKLKPASKRLHYASDTTESLHKKSHKIKEFLFFYIKKILPFSTGNLKCIFLVRSISTQSKCRVQVIRLVVIYILI